MKKMQSRQFLYASVLLILIFACGFIWADNELKKVLGHSTEVINISLFVKSSKTVQIKNTNVLSEDCSTFIKNQDVLIKDGVIVQVGENQLADSEAAVIDGTNKYLIPGLVDSHVHLKESRNDLFLYLANGVTYIREMSGRPVVLEWRKSIQNTGIGPGMFIASPPVFSESGLSGYYYSWTRQSVNYSNKNDAQKALLKIKQQGYDAVKMYGFVSPEMFKMTMAVAKANHIAVIGHIPMVNLDDFYQSGQMEVAHVEELTIKTIDEFGKSVVKNPGAYLQFLKARSVQIAKKLKENGISVSSTVWLCESFVGQRFDLTSKLKAIELTYANPKIIEGTPLYKLGWLPGKNGYEYDGKQTADARKLSLCFWNTYAKAVHIMTKALVDHNVTLMAGTDANVATVVPGFSLHDELGSLVNCGMTNSQALYSATVAPGMWMKSKTGKIKIGYKSDLVLLAKSPLEDIKNTRSIDHVFFNQYSIDKNRIAMILKAIEDANNENRTIKIDGL